MGAYNIEPKLLWLERYEPESLARAARVVTTTVYVTFRLTGREVMNRADAGILHAYDARTGGWNRALLEEMGLDPELYPPIHECAEWVGAVSVDASQDTGLPVGTPVVAGGEDSPAAALSIGVVRPGDAFLSLGTAAVVGMCLAADAHAAALQVLTYLHVVPGVAIRSGSMSSAGAAVEWWSREMRGVYGDVRGLSEAAAESPPELVG